MSQFVDECRKEWKRLGVPEAAANEMAADLSTDLSEAEAEGVSPEEVLGNGIFDPAAFAASWADARGLVQQKSARFSVRGRPTWALIVGAAASTVTFLVGVVLLVGRSPFRDLDHSEAPVG
jgi:hypothetical protein